MHEKIYKNIFIYNIEKERLLFQRKISRTSFFTVDIPNFMYWVEQVLPRNRFSFEISFEILGLTQRGFLPHVTLPR